METKCCQDFLAAKKGGRGSNRYPLPFIPIFFDKSPKYVRIIHWMNRNVYNACPDFVLSEQGHFNLGEFKCEKWLSRGHLELP